MNAEWKPTHQVRKVLSVEWTDVRADGVEPQTYYTRAGKTIYAGIWFRDMEVRLYRLPANTEPEREALARAIKAERAAATMVELFPKIEYVEACTVARRNTDKLLAGYRREPEPREVDWGVQIVPSYVVLHNTEVSARENVAYWEAEGEAATLVSRCAASEWTPVTPSTEETP